MARRRSGYIQIDVSDCIDEIDDDDLLAEVELRKLSTTGPGESVDLEIVGEAYEELLRGRFSEAKAILDRILFPKWRSKASCENEYKQLFKS